MKERNRIQVRREEDITDESKEAGGIYDRSACLKKKNGAGVRWIYVGQSRSRAGAGGIDLDQDKEGWVGRGK